MEKPYVLQHKDIPIAVLMIDEIGTITDIGEAHNQKYLPVLCSGTVSLKTWWYNRSIPVNRQGIKEDLLEKGILDSRQLLIQNLGLSLTDCYWLRPYDCQYSWNDVNLFANPFHDSVIKLQPTESGMDLPNTLSFIPSSSLQGELRKKWIIANGQRVLIKGNYGTSRQQSLNEVFATLLHEKQAAPFPYTPYWLTALYTSEGETMGCACMNFCDNHTELVPAYEIAYSYKKRNEQSEYDAYLEYADRHGLDIRSFMEYQIASDFIITNTDRHFHNFGLLRNSDTLEYIGPAPIFDNGNSLFYKTPVPKGKTLYDIPVNSFRKRETDLLRYITNPGILDIKQLPTEESLYHLFKKDDGMPEEKRLDICQAYAAKISMYSDFANGASIWDYKYRT